MGRAQTASVGACSVLSFYSFLIRIRASGDTTLPRVFLLVSVALSRKEVTLPNQIELR